jgi:hypothetical protein
MGRQVLIVAMLCQLRIHFVVIHSGRNYQRMVFLGKMLRTLKPVVFHQPTPGTEEKVIRVGTLKESKIAKEGLRPFFYA